MEETIDDMNLMVMKLLHYFITEKNYNPIILQGAENEIWLENMEADYKIVRIVSNYIHNSEQFEFDIFKTKHIVKKIKRKTFTFNMNVLSIYTDVRDKDCLISEKRYTSVYIGDEKDIDNNEVLLSVFPDMKSKLHFSEEGMNLFIKITGDINNKNKKDQVQAEDIFKPKKPIITYSLIAINALIFILTLITNNYENIVNRFAVFGPYIVENHEFYRLITGAFLHGSVFHLLFNCYALYVIGSQIESYMGRVKYLIIYLFSALCGSLLSIILTRGASIGASGAIFGLMGAIIYFGYHYRVYLGTVVKTQIIPLIVFNLFIGFLFNGQIDNFGHIGGLIGGILSTMALGVKYKSSKQEIVNGIVMSVIFVGFLTFLAFNVL